LKGFQAGLNDEMELGTNFTAKLEPFLLISKSAKGAAAAKLVQDATSAPGVFVFAELLELPNIQEVCHAECLYAL
jgi:COP9 signalosome complex subunit 7